MTDFALVPSAYTLMLLSNAETVQAALALGARDKSHPLSEESMRLVSIAQHHLVRSNALDIYSAMMAKHVLKKAEEEQS